jgi:hypothetical protein
MGRVSGPQSTKENHDSFNQANRWAPWWLYLVIILPLNWARAAALPMSHLPEPAIVVIALTQAAILFLIITIIWRVTQRDRGGAE